MSQVIFLESYYRALLVFHLIMSFTLLGLVGHSVVYSFSYLKGQFTRCRTEYWITFSSVLLYAATFLSGALIYPVFRVRIRAACFDTSLPWATSLFEIKEHFASVGFVLMLSILFLRTAIKPEEDKDKLWAYFVFWILVCIILLYQTICGPYLVLLRSIQ
jgi:hypothetical protein